MKKETQKKSKLWLWILLAVLALAIIGGVVAAFVLPGLFQQQGPTGPVAEAKLYWNLDRLSWLEEETNMSAREKAEDGYYHIRYAFDGKVEELKITDDKRLVNFLDTQDVVCLAFDENGVVVDCAPANTYFTPAAKDVYTKRIQGNMLQLNSSMAMNGMDMEFDISNIPVYEVAEGSENKGSLTTPAWLDVVTIYNDLEGNPYAAYVTGHLAIDAEIGWRVEHNMYAASTGYKRVPDKDGVYTIPFAINGEIVNRYIKDYDMALSIEGQGMHTAYFALEYDEEGYIIDYENPAMAMQGIQLCAAFNVDSVENGNVTATRYMSGNNQGEQVQFTYDETCEIYQCCVGGCYEKHCGERIDSLEVGDLINVFTDLDGKPVLIYVAIRTVDTTAYYNLKRQWSSTNNETLRVPDEDGYYVFEMAVNGSVKTVRTKNKEFANKIDGNSNFVSGLKLSGSVIKKVYGIPCVSGRATAFSDRFVTSYTAPIISVAPFYNITSMSNWIMTPDCKIYTVDSDYGVKLGSKTDLKTGDLVLGLQNAQGEVNYIYVQQRYKSGYKIGYSMARKYSTAIGGSTRVPNADGYYVFDVAYDGKVTQLKTKNKAMADFIDLQSPPIFGFKEKNGIITDACAAVSAIPYGVKAYNNHYIENMDGGILNSWYMSAGTKNMGTAQWKITSKTKTYNVSKGYVDHPGEKTKPKVGDKIQALVNSSTGEIQTIFILNRSIDSPIYWQVARVAPRYVNGDLVGSNRVPDEDGYYVFDLLHDGKIKQFKTKDEMVAAQVDTYTQGLGLKLKKGTNIIERAVDAADTKYPIAAIGNQDVKKISGKTITTERCRLTSSNYGEVLTKTLGSKVKIYDVSSYAENWGAATKLKVGDRIVAYADLDGNIAYIFITKGAARDKGVWGYCDHCGKKVFWDSYSETFSANGHYYLPEDTVRTGAIVFGNTTDDAVYDQVFDLNGHTLKSAANAFAVYDKLTIVDSVGTGKISNGKGLSFNGSKQGGNIFVGEGGTFTLLSGTIENGTVGLAGIGSNISTYNGTVNIKGGTISGGVGYLGTAVYHSGTKGGINISGGKLNGSVYAEESNKITLSGAPTIEKLIVPAGNKIKLGNLKKGASITVKGDGIFTTESADINTLKAYFKPANSKDTITVSGKALKYNNLSGELVIPEPESPNKPLVLDENGMGQCVLCGEKVQWTALHEGDIIGDMNPAHSQFNAELFGGDQHQFHYYVAEDMTSGDGDFLYSWQGNSVCLHLNGKTLNVRGGFYGGNSSTINIYGEGKVHYLANSTTSYTAGNMFEAYTSNINLCGGEFTTATHMIHGAGSALQLSISDDAIINGNVKLDYGNVTISGNVYVKRITIGETAKLSVTKFFKGEASLSVAAGLEEGSLIPEANAAVLGKFTGKLTYSDFRNIVYKDGRLKVVGEAPSPNEPLVLDSNGKGICYVCGENVQWTALHDGDRIGDVHSDGQTVHYYVAEDMSAGEGDFQYIRDKSENVATKATVTICLHLNGKILNVKGVIEGGHGASINIMGDGVITNGGNKELFQLYSANLTLYGGEYYAGDYPILNPLGEAAKLVVTGDAKLYGNAELPFGSLTLKENARVDNINLGNTVVQKNIDADGIPDDVTVYGKVIVNANWAGKAKLTVDAGNMDGKQIKAESGVALGDFTGVLINQDGKKFTNNEGLLQLTSKTGSIPAAPATPEVPAKPTPALPEGINDNLVLDSENKAMCVHCGEEVVWTPIANGEKIGMPPAFGSTMHYYLTEDNTSTGLFFNSDNDTGNSSVCLHLNGHDLTSAQGFTLRNNNKFNLMGNGEVTVSDGLAFEIYTCTVNIYGGTYNADVVMDCLGDATAAFVRGDVVLNGLVRVKAGITYFAHKVSANNVDISGGKLQLANNWNGTMEISVADSVMDGSLVKATAVELLGAMDGTITHAAGVVTVVDKRLHIAVPEPETPVWGVFNPEACDNKAYCPVCGEAAGVFEWTKISNSSEAPGYKNNTEGNLSHFHYYLSKDINYNSGTQFIGLNKIGACLHLNGHKLTTTSRLFLTGSGYGLNIIAGEGGSIDYTGAYNDGGIITSPGALNLIGGIYTSIQTTGTIRPIIKVSSPANLTDAIVRGIADVQNTITVNGKTSLDNLALTGSGKLVIADGWDGDIVLNIAADDISNGLIKTSRAVVDGDFTGTITLTDGRSVVKEGNQLKVTTGGTTPPVTPTEPVWGTFDPWNFDGKAYCEHCGEAAGVQTWTALTGSNRIGAVGSELTSGAKHHVYLAENVDVKQTLTQTLSLSGQNTALCLHLNGKTLTNHGRMFATGATTLAIMGDGNVTFAADMTWTAGTAAQIAGYQQALVAECANGLYIYGGTYSVTGNAVTLGLPTIIATCPVYIKDATVKGFIEAKNGAVINLEKSAVADDIRIVGVGTTTTGKVVVATDWTGNAKLTLPEALLDDGLVAEANGAAKGDFIGTLTLANGQKLKNDNGRLRVFTTTPVWGAFNPWDCNGLAFCEACGEAAGPKNWTVYNGEYAETILDVADVGGYYHYYLDKDVNYETTNYLKTNENICFHLNGHKITAAGTNSSVPISCTQQLCIMGEGIVTGSATSSADVGSVFQVNGDNASASLKIYGGTYKKPANSTNPLLSVGENGGSVTIYGGTFDVNGSTVAGDRGNLLYVQGKGANKALVEIYGGTFIGDSRIGSKETGADFDGAASLKVLGGSFDGKIAVTHACEAVLGGTADVKEITVAADSKLIVKPDFTGKAALSFETPLVENKVSAANAVVEGGFAGFLTLADGNPLVADGAILKVPANAALLKNLEFTAGTKMAVCPLCGGEPVLWTDLNATGEKRIGYNKNKGHLHFYLSDDFVATETARFAELAGTTTLCLHLNGHDMILSSQLMISDGSVANILGRGNVLFEGDCYNTNAAQATLDKYNSVGFEVNGTLNVYGGNYATDGAAKDAGKPMMKVGAASGKLNLFDVSVAGVVQVVAGNASLDASALINAINVTSNGKLNVVATFTGSAAASFATGLVDDAVPAANGASTGAFTGKLTLLNGTVLIGSGGKLVKQPVNP